MPTYTQPCGYAVTVDTSDLIHIFKPYSSGSTPAPDTGYKANSNYGGQDLSEIFQPRGNSAAILYNTNYTLSDGTDLANVFMNINYFPYSATIIDNGIKVTPNKYNKNTAYYQFNNVGSNSSFQIYNPTAPIVVNYILIGGGGGGGSSGASNTGYGTGPGSGTGGEGGQCTSGSFAISSNNTYDVTIGGGGSGGQPPSIPPKPNDESNGNGGNPGTLSKIEIISSILFESSGGAGGYGGYNNSGAGSDQNGPNNIYSENPNQYYGGGGGNGSAGGYGQSGTGSAGGSIGGTVTSYDGTTTFIWGGGGGGGNANGSTSNSGGSNNNGGHGGNYYGSNEFGGSASTPGGGGGGGVSTGGTQVESWPGASGGNGGNGTLLIWWTIPS